MSSLRDIRSRINSIKSTRQITAAMKMVSAAKLKKAQDRISSMRPYVKELCGIIDNLSEHLTEKHENVFTEDREVKKVLVILIAANRGLCGGFNANIGKKAVSFVNETYPELIKDENLDFFCYGKKAKDFIKKAGFNIIGNDTGIFDNLNYENISKIATSLMEDFKVEKYDRIELVYNSFKIASQSNLTAEAFLPYTINKKQTEFPTEYIFEPDMDYLTEIIIPDYLKTKLFSVFLDHIAAEHGARMTAMHQATDNATDLIKDLTLVYNKARQAAITKEILEITSGAEALRGS